VRIVVQAAGVAVLSFHRIGLCRIERPKRRSPPPTIRSRISEESRRDCAGAARAHTAPTQESNSIERNFQPRGAGGRERESRSRAAARSSGADRCGREILTQTLRHICDPCAADPWCSRPGCRFRNSFESLRFRSHVRRRQITRNSPACNLPLAARPRVGHIGPDGAVAEWLKAAVC
jgi:hypothetical protein